MQKLEEDETLHNLFLGIGIFQRFSETQTIH